MNVNISNCQIIKKNLKKILLFYLTVAHTDGSSACVLAPHKKNHNMGLKEDTM